MHTPDNVSYWDACAGNLAKYSRSDALMRGTSAFPEHAWIGMRTGGSGKKLMLP